MDIAAEFCGTSEVSGAAEVCGAAGFCGATIAVVVVGRQKFSGDELSPKSNPASLATCLAFSVTSATASLASADKKILEHNLFCISKINSCKQEDEIVTDIFSFKAQYLSSNQYEFNCLLNECNK